jgi:acetolactate synthase-1/2/3 large subunit
MGKIHGGQMIVKALQKEGANHIFSISGGHLAPIYDALIDSDLSLQITRHEQAAVMMADAMGRLTGQPGVALVTAGPGFTNCLTSVANARMANVPVVIIGGAVPTDMVGRLDLQEIPQIEVITPLVKWARRIENPARIMDAVHEAFHHARSGNPGPVYLEIPADILGTQVEDSAVAGGGMRPVAKVGADPAEINKTIELLLNASKPIIIAGSGAWFARASDSLRTFVEQSGIPVFTTGMGKGVIPDNHPLCFGPGFGIRPGAALPALLQADTVFLLATRISLFFAHGNIFNPNTKIIEATIDPDEIGRNRKVEVGFVGDAGLVLTQLIAASKGRFKPDKYKPWVEELKKARENAMALFKTQLESDQVPIHPLRLCHELDKFLKEDDFLAVDGGDTSVWMNMVRTYLKPGHTLESGLFGCLGVGLPYAVGLQLENPGSRVAVIVGDGAVGFNFMEFHTMLRLGLPVVAVVNNDQAWGMVRHSQMLRYGKDRIIGVDLGYVPYHKMVEALGGYGEEVTKPDQIRPALERAFASKKPALINVLTERDIISPGSHALASIGKKEGLSSVY